MTRFFKILFSLVLTIGVFAFVARDDENEATAAATQTALQNVLSDGQYPFSIQLKNLDSSWLCFAA